MKPNDANGKLPPGARPVLLIAGSDRRQYDIAARPSAAVQTS
jgi:hypothetical protein